MEGRVLGVLDAVCGRSSIATTAGSGDATRDSAQLPPEKRRLRHHGELFSRGFRAPSWTSRAESVRLPKLERPQESNKS